MDFGFDWLFFFERFVINMVTCTCGCVYDAHLLRVGTEMTGPCPAHTWCDTFEPMMFDLLTGESLL